jgi:hypothetical protein
MVFKTVSGSGTIVSRSSWFQEESISKATAAAGAQVSKVCFHRAIQGIKLLYHVQDKNKLEASGVCKTLAIEFLISSINKLFNICILKSHIP